MQHGENTARHFRALHASAMAHLIRVAASPLLLSRFSSLNANCSCSSKFIIYIQNSVTPLDCQRIEVTSSEDCEASWVVRLLGRGEHPALVTPYKVAVRLWSKRVAMRRSAFQSLLERLLCRVVRRAASPQPDVPACTTSCIQRRRTELSPSGDNLYIRHHENTCRSYIASTAVYCRVGVVVSCLSALCDTGIKRIHEFFQSPHSLDKCPVNQAAMERNATSREQRGYINTIIKQTNRVWPGVGDCASTKTLSEERCPGQSSMITPIIQITKRGYRPSRILSRTSYLACCSRRGTFPYCRVKPIPGLSILRRIRQEENTEHFDVSRIHLEGAVPHCLRLLRNGLFKMLAYLELFPAPEVVKRARGREKYWGREKLIVTVVLLSLILTQEHCRAPFSNQSLVTILPARPIANLPHRAVNRARFPVASLLEFRKWEWHPNDAADWRVFSGSPVSPPLHLRCSILTSFHPHRPPKSVHVTPLLIYRLFTVKGGVAAGGGRHVVSRGAKRDAAGELLPEADIRARVSGQPPDGSAASPHRPWEVGRILSSSYVTSQYSPFTVTLNFSEALLNFYFQDILPPRSKKAPQSTAVEVRSGHSAIKQCLRIDPLID
ncbi:hypothetical protein PR048_006281 [Dryococelus australis]|uniref:Uncharacterized protein n=1 Tax=Dryococelus australis TaxID=614101 RepID=A0ABQ9IAK0_9NEOP|nr:hypothetical protein PR048_006281 [Dryococelus australis]